MSYTRILCCYYMVSKLFSSPLFCTFSALRLWWCLQYFHISFVCLCFCQFKILFHLLLSLLFFLQSVIPYFWNLFKIGYYILTWVFLKFLPLSVSIQLLSLCIPRTDYMFQPYQSLLFNNFHNISLFQLISSFLISWLFFLS